MPMRVARGVKSGFSGLLGFWAVRQDLRKMHGFRIPFLEFIL